MFKNSIILRMRALWRNRSHAAINIIGLSLGITSAITIFLILRFELSTDSFRQDHDRIYRVVVEFKENGTTGSSSGGTYPLVPALRADFPDAEYVSLVDLESPVILITRSDGGIDKFKENHVVFVDSSYFKIIDQVWIHGGIESLTKPNTVVLTETVAKKYFGEKDPINKVISYNGEFELTVTGLIKDGPENTDFNFSIYINNNLGTQKRGWDNWGASASDVNCILKLHNGVTREQMEAKMKGWHMKYFAGHDNEDDGKNRTYKLQPLSEIHFDDRYYNPGGRIVSKNTLMTLGLIGIGLLLTACINFINLNTVLVIDRSREAGVRKVLGSTQFQLIVQFLSETVVITLISLLISSGLVELILLRLSGLLGYKVEFHPFTDVPTILCLIAVMIVVTTLAGLYPAIKLSDFQPVKALKNKIGAGPQKGVTIRRSLIVFQLIISQVLIVCTIIVVQQIDHFMSQPLGLKSEAVVEIPLPERGAELMNRLSERMHQIQGVANYTASNTGSISDGQWNGNAELTVHGKAAKELVIAKMADENYIDTYGIELLEGENLVRSDTATRFLVNETFCKVLGFKTPADAIGTQITFWGRRAMISGVVKDYNAMPLQNKIEPLLIYCNADSYFNGAVRLSTINMALTLADIKRVWEDVFPKYVFEYKFLDDSIKGFYDGERRVSYMIGLFASVAIFIGCIGLFGLISFMARQKTKEIGVRKTLGATVTQIVGLFSKEFLILVGISFLISVPITYYFMGEWLSNFEYRIHPGVFTFMLGAMFTLLVVLTTVGLKSYRAAIANPVNALRDE